MIDWLIALLEAEVDRVKEEYRDVDPETDFYYAGQIAGLMTAINLLRSAALPVGRVS
jgi:hypothetical protein